MTDANVISIAITLFAIAAGSLFNNVRISDSTAAINKRFDDFRDLIRSEHSKLDMKLDRIEQTLTAIVGDHETRIRAHEHRQS